MTLVIESTHEYTYILDSLTRQTLSLESILKYFDLIGFFSDITS